MFGCGIGCLFQEHQEFAGPQRGTLELWIIFLRMLSTDKFLEYQSEGLVIAGILCFMFVAFLFIFNMLIAQLCCSYDKIYFDMVGMARLYRLAIIVDIVPTVSDKRFFSFVAGMSFDQKLEFNAGDIGVTGGIQVTEPSNANPTTKDTIIRFGGSTDPSAPWPGTDDQEDDSDKFERLEKAIQKALAKASTAKKAAGKMGSKAGSSMQNSSANQSGASGSMGSGEE